MSYIEIVWILALCVYTWKKQRNIGLGGISNQVGTIFPTDMISHMFLPLRSVCMTDLVCRQTARACNSGLFTYQQLLANCWRLWWSGRSIPFARKAIDVAMVHQSCNCYKCPSLRYRGWGDGFHTSTKFGSESGRRWSESDGFPEIPFIVPRH